MDIARGKYFPRFAQSPPVNVAPHIRFARWAALFAGVLYGYTRHRRLQYVENQKKVSKDKVLAEQAERQRKIEEARGEKWPPANLQVSVLPD